MGKEFIFEWYDPWVRKSRLVKKTIKKAVIEPIPVAYHKKHACLYKFRNTYKRKKGDIWAVNDMAYQTTLISLPVLVAP